MQHAIINAMKCMRAIKDRIARPVYQPANHISRASIPHMVYQSGKSSVRDLQDPSAHHSSVVFRHDKSVGHHSDDSVGLFRHDDSVDQSQRGSQSAIIITSLIAMFMLKAVKSAQFVPSTADSTSTDSYKGTVLGTKKTISSSYICPADGSQYKHSAVGLVFMESAAGLAMETSKVESAVRNQEEAKLNQLEHDEPAETMTTSCKR
ncbi:hypothetical protein F511_16102 [Dorcoceras hygrometricum]|uniref:Uncharacterized protein n=1 Tax=Dorcoceras hygrometricum TaxID=472368 RepID=A0A2Z7CVV3_9LAMI|nr:hypothetical protein F511_16102 [Dorcoceras hygrometricum]